MVYRRTKTITKRWITGNQRLVIFNFINYICEPLTEEYKEVTDYKKIGLVIGLVVCVAIILFLFLASKPFEFPETSMSQEQQLEQIKPQPVREEYQKFIDLGLSIDDIIDFQEMPCETFNTPEMISTDPKYTAIIEQRRSDCF